MTIKRGRTFDTVENFWFVYMQSRTNSLIVICRKLAYWMGIVELNTVPRRRPPVLYTSIVFEIYSVKFIPRDSVGLNVATFADFNRVTSCIRLGTGQGYAPSHESDKIIQRSDVNGIEVDIGLDFVGQKRRGQPGSTMWQFFLIHSIKKTHCKIFIAKIYIRFEQQI